MVFNPLRAIISTWSVNLSIHDVYNYFLFSTTNPWPISWKPSVSGVECLNGGLRWLWRVISSIIFPYYSTANLSIFWMKSTILVNRILKSCMSATTSTTSFIIYSCYSFVYFWILRSTIYSQGISKFLSSSNIILLYFLSFY